MPKKPNILFFMCDQLTPLATSPYRKGMAITPTLQRLADEGTTFDSAYCNSPLCNPSRTSMMSGRYCSDIGVYHNAGVLPVDTPCFTHYLREAGYHTILSGKMHFNGPDQLHGFNERLTTDIYPGEMDWVDDWSLPKEEEEGNDEIGPIYQATAPLDGNKYQAYDEEATFRAQQWLRHYARSNTMGKDPFFLCVSLTNPHHPYVAPKEMWDLYENREIPKPRVGPLEPDNSNAKWLQESLGLDKKWVSPEDTQLARRGYFACTSFVDSQLKKVIDCLETLDIDENTWIVFTSDHGDMIGERGLWLKKLFYESATRVPLIIRKPGGENGGQRRSQPVSLVDMLPTFADIGQTRQVDKTLPGRSLVPALDNPKALADGHCISEYMGSCIRGPIRLVREGKYKYISIHPTNNHEQLLYNIEEDPDELNNLIDKPEYADIATHMRELCTQDGWDGQKVNSQVRDNQQRYLFLSSANGQKRSEQYTYVPPPVDPHDPEKFGLLLNDPRRPQVEHK